MANESKQISFEIIIPMGNITIGKTKTRLSSILSPVQRKNLSLNLFLCFCEKKMKNEKKHRC